MQSSQALGRGREPVPTGTYICPFEEEMLTPILLPPRPLGRPSHPVSGEEGRVARDATTATQQGAPTLQAGGLPCSEVGGRGQATNDTFTSTDHSTVQRCERSGQKAWIFPRTPVSPHVLPRLSPVGIASPPGAPPSETADFTRPCTTVTWTTAVAPNLLMFLGHFIFQLNVCKSLLRATHFPLTPQWDPWL